MIAFSIYPKFSEGVIIIDDCFSAVSQKDAIISLPTTQYYAAYVPGLDLRRGAGARTVGFLGRAPEARRGRPT